MKRMAARNSRIARWAFAVTIIVSVSLLASCGFVQDRGSDESVPGIYEVPAEGEKYSSDGDGMADSRDYASVQPSPPIEPPGDGTGVDASTVPADERYIIRSVGVRIQVDDVEDAVQSVRDEVAKAEGMVTAVQVSTDEDIPIYRYEATGALADGAPLRGFVVARIPAPALDAFIESVSDLGTVQRQAEDESDVTQEHIDLSARLENLKAQEERLRDFFDRAENVEDMLAIEAQLGRVRGEIESLTAQIAYIERQAAMATVTIELAGVPPVVSPIGSDWGFVRAITQGIRGFVGTINTLVVLVMSALPLIIIAVVVWLAVRAVLRRRRPRTKESTPPEEPMT
ncbi:MAG: DUF4349 domain-containing protein [Coriobacteriia bacterium]|nr:DUF4349 domain-containing protein [Coriobacteriia bacterium]